MMLTLSVQGQSLQNRRLITINKNPDATYSVQAWVDTSGGATRFIYSTAGEIDLCTDVNSSAMSGNSGESNYVEMWFNPDNTVNRVVFVQSSTLQKSTRLGASFNSGELTNIENLRVDVIDEIDPVLAGSYFVSNAGNDANDGRTQSTPWRTLHQVTNSTFTAGDSILFKRGDTFYGQISLKGTSKSGTVVSNIIFNAYGSGELPIITGFTNITSWSNVNGNLWSSSGAISALGSCNVVSINGVNTQRGKTPNGTAKFAIDSSGANYITSSSITAATNYVGGELLLYNSQFSCVKRTITNQYVNTLAYSGTDVSLTSEEGFFVQNHTNCLDSASEWMLDASNNKLYIYSSGSPSESIQAANINTILSMANNDQITFKNLHITGANQYGYFNNSSETNTLQSLLIDFIGYNGVNETLGVNATGILISDCVFSNCNNNAISMAATSGTGGMKRGLIQRNTIVNSGLYPGHYNTGSSSGSGQAIRANGEYMVMDRNIINYTGYTGISFFGTNSVVSRNFINNTLQALADGGAIYSWNATSSDTPDGCVNSYVTSNIIMNAGPSAVNPSTTLLAGVYLDANTSGVTTYGNTMYKTGAGFFMNYGHNCVVANNNIMDGRSYGMFIDIDKNTSTLDNVNVYGNTVIVTNTGSIGVRIDSSVGIPATLTMNTNGTARPATLTGTQSTNFYYYSGHKSLPNWQAATGLDLTSFGKPPNSVTAVSDIVFNYNASDTNQTYTLPFTCVDMVTNVYTSPITLTPWTSKTLLKQ